MAQWMSQLFRSYSNELVIEGKTTSWMRCNLKALDQTQRLTKESKARWLVSKMLACEWASNSRIRQICFNNHKSIPPARFSMVLSLSSNRRPMEAQVAASTFQCLHAGSIRPQDLFMLSKSSRSQIFPSRRLSDQLITSPMAISWTTLGVNSNLLPQILKCHSKNLQMNPSSLFSKLKTSDRHDPRTPL